MGKLCGKREKWLFFQGVAEILQNELLEGCVIPGLAAFHVIDGAFLQQRHKAAATETEGKVRAIKTFILLPDIHVVGVAKIPDAALQVTHVEPFQPDERRAFVQGTVVMSHQVVLELDHAGGGLNLGRKISAPQDLLPQVNRCIHQPWFVHGAAAVGKFRHEVLTKGVADRCEYDMGYLVRSQPQCQKLVQKAGKFAVILLGEVAADPHLDNVADIQQIFGDEIEAPFSGGKRTEVVMVLSGAVQGNPGALQSERNKLRSHGGGKEGAIGYQGEGISCHPPFLRQLASEARSI